MSHSLDLSGHSVRTSKFRTAQCSCLADLFVFSAIAFGLGSPRGVTAADDQPTTRPAAPVIKARPTKETNPSPQESVVIPPRSAAD